MMRIMGRHRALVAVVAGTFLLSGCGSGPSQIGAAVIVGDKTISVDAVQAMIDKAVREQPYAQTLAKEHKLDVLGREIVRQQVLHELIAKAVPEQKLGVNQAEVDQALSSGTLDKPVPADASDQASAVQAVVLRVRDHRESLIDAYIQRTVAQQALPNLAVTLDFAFVTADETADAAATRTKAIELAKQFASGPKAATDYIAQIKQSDPNLQAGQSTQYSVQSPSLAGTALFGAPVNSVVAVQTDPAKPTSWVVAVIRGRDVAKPPSTDQTPTPTSAQLDSFGAQLLQSYLPQVNLRVSPRYGVWDLVTMNLASSEATTAGVVLPVRGAASQQ